MEYLFNIIIYLFMIISIVGLLWVLYLSAMSIDYAISEGKISPICIPFAMILYLFILYLNMIVQYFIFTILFLDFPKEDTVSDRLSRYKNNHVGWRNKLAIWIGSHFLDPFDRRGYHI